MSERWTRATGICQCICKAHVFDETFGVNSAFNAEVFVAPPHTGAMEFDLFGERRSSHWVKGGGSAKGSFWLDCALGNRTVPDLTRSWVYSKMTSVSARPRRGRAVAT